MENPQDGSQIVLPASICPFLLDLEEDDKYGHYSEEGFFSRTVRQLGSRFFRDLSLAPMAPAQDKDAVSSVEKQYTFRQEYFNLKDGNYFDCIVIRPKSQKAKREGSRTGDEDQKATTFKGSNANEMLLDAYDK